MTSISFTVPLKYRSAKAGVPSQLVASLNAPAYAGYRIDRFKLSNASDPLGNLSRETNHFGLSIGLLSGIGSSIINLTTTTQDTPAIDYEGLIWQSGVSGIIGLNNFTIGVALRFDQLLDGNSDIWIYNSDHCWERCWASVRIDYFNLLAFRVEPLKTSLKNSESVAKSLD